MRNTLRQSVLIFSCLTLLSLGGQAAAVMLSLQPASQTAVPSDVVSVDLVIEGLTSGGAESLGAFDIDVAFDNAALSLSSYSLGSMLGDLSAGEAFDFSFGDLGGGLINVLEVSYLLVSELDALQSASFVLATLDFMVDVLNSGTSTAVAIDTIHALGDAYGDPLTVARTTNAVIYNPPVSVPEPGVFSLISIGLLGLFLPQCRVRRGFRSAVSLSR